MATAWKWAKHANNQPIRGGYTLVLDTVLPLVSAVPVLLEPAWLARAALLSWDSQEQPC